MTTSIPCCYLAFLKEIVGLGYGNPELQGYEINEKKAEISKGQKQGEQMKILHASRD